MSITKCILIAIILTNVSVHTFAKDINLLYSIAFEEKDVILNNIPVKIIPINDSVLIYIKGDDAIYYSNYKSGKFLKSVNLHDLVNVKEIAFKYEDIDTGNAAYDEALKSIKEVGMNDIFIESATMYDDDLLLTVDFSFPTMTTEGDKITYSQIKKPFLLFFNVSERLVTKVTPFDLTWNSEKSEFEAPVFGFGICGNNIYVAKVAMPFYNGDIFSVFDKKTLERIEPKYHIFHEPFENNTGLALVSNFSFTTINENECYVTNRHKLHGLRTGEEILDASKYIDDVSTVYFFAPLNTNKSKFYLYYSSQYDKNNRKFPKHAVILDTETKLVSKISDNPSVSALYKNNIISLEKNENSYNYVVYDIH